MLRQSIHITLILSILLSSVGLVIQKHFCQNELKSISLFLSAGTCHEEKADTPPCPFHATSSSQEPKDSDKKDCCNNTVELIKLDEEALTSVHEILLTEHVLLYGLIPLVLDLSSALEQISFPDFLNYKPPLLVCNYPVSLQTFLC